MDDKLKTTIDKILRLCAQNPEFDKELRRRLGLYSMASSLAINNTSIKNVEKYLGLDFYVDSQDSVIDYSSVVIPEVRAQLISDNREMMRFRYGTRYHKIDFKEFCRYAHLQSEMLLNYYYDIINHSDLKSIKTHIRQYNSKAIGLEDAVSLASISYTIKLWAFKNEHKIDYNLFENIRKVRNELSHRSIEEKQIEISTYQNFLKAMGFKLNTSGEPRINWKDNNFDNELKEIFNKKIRDSKEYKQYLYIVWYLSMPYDSIINGLKHLSNIVLSSSNNDRESLIIIQ